MPVDKIKKKKKEKKVAFIEREGKQFVIPERESKALAARGKLAPGETIEAQQRKRELRGKFVEDPSQFGLQRPGEVAEGELEGLEIERKETTEQAQARVKKLYEETGYTQTAEERERQKNLPLLSKENLMATAQSFGGGMGAAGMQAVLSLGAVAGGWKVAGETIVSPIKALKAGTTAKNAGAAGNIITKFRDFSIGLLAAGATVGGIIGFFNRKVDDQQTGLNTLGTITSTIVGDSKTAAGDAQKGLNELRHIRREVLKLERDIKQGTIESAQLKFSGKIVDINADIYDQLATIDEGIRDIQDFMLLGQIPEMNEFEIQQMLRELEEEGHLKPVDLTRSRRETST